MRVQFIRARDTWQLRQQVLRPHQTVEEMDYPNDRNPDSFHLGALDMNTLVGIASFYKEKHEGMNGWIQWRLRGMAVDPHFQGKGVGRMLLKFAMDELKVKQVDVLWCNARENAMGFYQAHGFLIHGEPFPIEGIGMHYMMYRRI
ncbi:MAG: GNAT family N-acetyltransferase [Flavobacteriales bacterium]|nr:GNAT family N-acetyltransferase [Flavobacteriales bacterium]